MIDGNMSHARYARMRIETSFGPHSMCVPYVLVNYQIFRACQVRCTSNGKTGTSTQVKRTAVAQVADAIKHVGLEADMQRMLADNPNFTREDAVRRMMTTRISATIPDSPSYYREKLHTILALVRKVVICSCCNVTSDDVSDSMFQELRDMEKVQHPTHRDFAPQKVSTVCMCICMCQCTS